MTTNSKTHRTKPSAARGGLKKEAEPFKFGTVTVPPGKRGPWTIDHFEIKEKDEHLLFNLRAIRDGNAHHCVHPGKFVRLVHEQRGVVMSNTRMEVITAMEPYVMAMGRVLVSGLGLGMVLEGILSKPDVTFVRVLEIDADLIALVAPHFRKAVAAGRLEIVQADVWTYVPPKGEPKFDYGWHDIWDNIDAENLPAMTKLVRRYRRWVALQDCWSREDARRDKRRYG